jgi:diguanylate cyclase (GGDEF)-like protein
MPRGGFALCLPVVYDSWTLGAILVGPTEREIPRQREVGLTVSMLSSVTMMSALTLKQQRNLAKTDGLTGLLNKTHLLRRIEDAMDAEGANPRPISVFLFDIDHFKHYNDTNGHIPGDDLLRALSALLADTVREGEFVGRYGGEEFLLVMPGVEGKKALYVAERLRRLIDKHAFAFGEKQPLGRLTISGGVATWPVDAENTEALLRCADEALYQAKRAGRNHIVVYARSDLSYRPPARDLLE